MKFTQFNLAAIVARFNQVQGTGYKPDHTFGLMSLDKSMRTALQQTIDSLEKSAQNTCGALPTKQRTKVKENIYSDVKLDNLRKVRSGIGTVGEDDRKLRAHQWYTHNQGRLNSDVLWDNFERSAQDNSTTGRVLFLKRWWARQADFAHFTSQGVWFVASNLLCAFADFENISSYELKKMRRKVPGLIYEEYNNYLSNMREQIKATKEKLCWSMLARLEVAESNGNLAFDDVILHLARKLDSNNLLKTKNGFIKTPRHGLTPELFNLFHGYILDNGNKEQVETLLKRRWFSSQGKCSTFRTDKQMLVLPKKIVSAQLVPKKVRLKFLFRYKHFRYQFFSDKLSLMARLEQVSSDKSHLSVTDFNTLKAHLRRSADTIESVKLLDNHGKRWQPRGLLKYICTSTKRFVDIWNEFSKDKKEQLIDKQADTIIAFGRRFIGQFDRVSDLAKMLPVDQIHYLQDYIHQLLVRCRDQSRCNSLRVLMNSLLDLKNKSLNQDKEIIPQVTKVEQVKSANVAKQEGILEAINSMDLFNLSKDKFDEFIFAIHSACNHIDLESRGGNSKAIFNSMETLFVQSLEHSIKLIVDQNLLLDDYLKEINHLMEQYAPKHIVDRLCELRIMRDNHVDIDVYQLKCESFQYSYSSDESSDNSDDEKYSAVNNLEKLVDQLQSQSPMSAVV